ncbi:hypothetical protein GRF29_213g1344068 [Pseudopithomyces chartarum]|uniref:FAD-binding domain-containing protein n=1 Tax=Pseudopithomyces chartarum TaxID=1892770 RepID=A0AAN6LR04_9PLEO|nr:hypothetical protein GRF29_213g1344068 [Pseudopithomyces chartarum]
MDSSTTKTPHVLILGAGLGGLTLAQSLRKKGITFRVFERDSDPHARPQGWAIALHSILDEFHASMPEDLMNFEQVNHLRPLTLPAEIALYREGDDRKYGGRDDGTGKFVRAKRNVLRNWLCNHINVEYGKKAERIKETDDGVVVHFADGTSASGDVVVGADGVHSITWHYIFGGRQNDPMRVHKSATINGLTQLSGSDFAEQLSLGHSSYIVFFERKGQQYMLFIGLDSVSNDGKTGNYYWNLIWACEDGDRDDHWAYTGGQKELLAHTKSVIEALKPEFRKVVDMTPEHMVLVPGLHFHVCLIDELPAGRVTLLGDAAHAMPPFRGEGGCQAMDDALKLARAIEAMEKTDVNSIRTFMDSYQREMLERGGKAARLSAEVLQDNRNPSERVVGGQTVRILPRDEILV